MYINDTGVKTKKKKLKESEQEDKQKAIYMRQTAMERFGQTKKRESSENSSDLNEKRPQRSSSDTIEFLKGLSANILYSQNELTSIN